MLKNRRKALTWVGIVFIIFFAYIIYAANQGDIPPFIRRIYVFPGGDKIGHIVLLGFLSLFINLFRYPRTIKLLRLSVFQGSLFVFCFITFEEISQILISSRTFDLIDLLCSYVGLFLGDISIRILGKNTSISNTAVNK